jgi:uncharacterized membrane protein
MGLPETKLSGVPRTGRYGPVVTFLQTLVDMKSSKTVVPGVFEAKGTTTGRIWRVSVQAVYSLDATEEQMKRSKMPSETSIHGVRSG